MRKLTQCLAIAEKCTQTRFSINPCVFIALSDANSVNPRAACYAVHRIMHWSHRYVKLNATRNYFRSFNCDSSSLRVAIFSLSLLTQMRLHNLFSDCMEAPGLMRHETNCRCSLNGLARALARTCRSETGTRGCVEMQSPYLRSFLENGVIKTCEWKLSFVRIYSLSI